MVVMRPIGRTAVRRGSAAPARFVVARRPVVVARALTRPRERHQRQEMARVAGRREEDAHAPSGGSGLGSRAGTSAPGRRTTKRAPGWASSSDDAAAVRLGHGAHDREARGRGGAAVARAADEALEDAARAARAPRPGRRPATVSTTSPLSRLDLRADVGARRRVADRVLHEVERQAVAARRGRRRPPRRRRRRSGGGRRRRARARPPTSTSTRLMSVGSRGCWRLASARASSSRSPTRRRIRCEERSAEPRGLAALAVEHVGQQLEVGEDRGQRRAQLVRGVGDELALAVQGAPRSPRATPRARRAWPAACARARRPRRRPRGWGMRLRRVAGALRCRARRVSQRRSGPSRGGEQDAAEQREQRAAEHAGGEEEPDAADRRLDVGDLARVLDDDREQQPARSPVSALTLRTGAARLDAVAADRARCAAGSEAEVRARPSVCVDRRAVVEEDPDRGVARRRVVVRGRAGRVGICPCGSCRRG